VISIFGRIAHTCTSRRMSAIFGERGFQVFRITHGRIIEVHIHFESLWSGVFRTWLANFIYKRGMSFDRLNFREAGSTWLSSWTDLVTRDLTEPRHILGSQTESVVEKWQSRKSSRFIYYTILVSGAMLRFEKQKKTYLVMYEKLGYTDISRSVFNFGNVNTECGPGVEERTIG